MEFELEPSPEVYHPPKPKVKKVDFWNQTDFKRKPEASKAAKAPLPHKPAKAWARDFSEIVKNGQRSPPANDISNSHVKDSQFEESLQVKSQDPEDFKVSRDSEAFREKPRENYSGKDVRFTGFDKKFYSDPNDMKSSTDSKEYHKQSSGANEILQSGSRYKSSGSSMSHYNPTEDMKKFYRNEFGRFLESKGTNKDEESED